jgi:hypothetical protein
MKCHWLNNQHGSALLFTTVTLVLLLVFGGIAIDVTYFGSVRREIQASMDAAALAGAGNLGFDDTAFPAARAAAQNYAGLNGYSDPAAGSIALNLNTVNDPNGQIVLGIWDGKFSRVRPIYRDLQSARARRSGHLCFPDCIERMSFCQCRSLQLARVWRGRHVYFQQRAHARHHFRHKYRRMGEPLWHLNTKRAPDGECNQRRRLGHVQYRLHRSSIGYNDRNQQWYAAISVRLA